MSDVDDSSDPDTVAEASVSRDQDLPAVDFSTFVLSLGHSVLMNLGAAPDPDQSEAPLNLVMAQQTIEVIALLAEKTRGNLKGEEERLMEQLLYDLRQRYAAVSSKS